MEQPITVWLVILFPNSAFPQNSHRLSSAFSHLRGEYVADPVFHYEIQQKELWPLHHVLGKQGALRGYCLAYKPIGSAHSEIGDAASRDGLSGVNLHTKGTEFYGNSSNLAFVGNLFTSVKNQAYTRAIKFPATGSYTKAAINRSQPFSPATVTGARRLSSKAQLSIMTLLYNADYTGQFSPHSLNRVECAAKDSPSFIAGQSDAGAINSGKS
ncbi:hypothetical protein PEBR_41294 [Penicillium brasilianum]|uniref:Uncharacterized protein n=1 Tax=Penicillium brasilianum TaxID=104259 RepID=A0A1S9R8L0_PENBI|nr:hypothetical protein PEBR_41294 [Penicillium brasilianum]